MDTAFESLFRAHYGDLLRFATRRVGSDAAADVVAETFTIAWRRRAIIPVGDERVWLFGVAAKVVSNEQRSTARRGRLEERVTSQPSTSSADPGEVVPVAVTVRAALATLNRREQEALRLTEWDGLDAGEAARVAGCSRAAFRVRLHRARRHLAERLDEFGPTSSSTLRPDSSPPVAGATPVSEWGVTA